MAGAVAGRMVEAVPPDRLLEHVDLDAILDQVDVNHLLDRVDVDRVLDRVDVDRLLDRIDLESLVRRAGIADIVAETTGSLAGSTLDTVRRQLVSVDALIGRRSRRPGPPRLVAPEQEGRREVVSGRYAGAVTRLLAFAADLGIGLGSFAVVSELIGWMWSHLLDRSVPDLSGIWATAALLGWVGGYLVIATIVAGRTIGKALVGLRVTRRDGTAVGPASALFRVVFLPISTSFFAAGLLWSLVDRERRTFHDVLARTVVVYDWGDRPAELSGPLTAFLRRHGEESTSPVR